MAGIQELFTEIVYSIMYSHNSIQRRHHQRHCKELIGVPHRQTIWKYPMQWSQRDAIHNETEDHLTGYVSELEDKFCLKGAYVV